MNDTNGAAQNTDRQLWSRETQAEPFKSYASIHVTKEGAIGICLGGLCIVRPIEDWHGAFAPKPEPAAASAVCAVCRHPTKLHTTNGYCPECSGPCQPKEA